MDIDKIPKGILASVRQRLGAKDEDDTSCDDIIINLSPKEIIAKWCGWHLGDESWGNTIIDYYNALIERDEAKARTIV